MCACICVRFNMKIVFYIKLEAFLSSDCLIEPSKDKYGLAIDLHTHSQVTSCPKTSCIEVNKSPHVQIDVIHLNSVGDFFFVELCSAREDINIFVIEDA